jgi:hypothetical protein
MSRYFDISITGGTSQGPYTIYYNTVVNGNVVNQYPSNNLATGITLSQLLSGVEVVTPNNATSIIIYNQKCNTYQSLNVGVMPPTYSCICITITNKNDGKFNQFYFCPNGNVINGKPEYTTTISATTYSLTWNTTNNYWVVQDLPGYLGLSVRSTNPTDSPISPWNIYGNNAQNYLVTGKEGVCTSPTLVYNISCESTDASCFGVNDGSIISTANGGYGGWKYSLDGITFGNTTGIFTNLGGGSYNVYAKDISGNTTQCSVTIDAPQPTVYALPLVLVSNDFIGNSGNMKYYKVVFNIATSSLPVGVSVTFDYKLTYSFNYVQPEGPVYFDTTQNQISINSVPQVTTLTSSTPLSIIGNSTCNPIYKKYAGNNVYKSTYLTVNSTSVVTGYAVYGIDTETNGDLLGPCITTGNMAVNMTLENIQVNNPCDSVGIVPINAYKTQVVNF